MPYVMPTFFGWQISPVFEKTARGVADASFIGLNDKTAGWTPFKGDPSAGAFMDIHSQFDKADGLVYLGQTLKVARSEDYEFVVGHDGGIRLFVDGACVLTKPELVNPAVPDRSRVRIKLEQGNHEIILAFDLAGGKGWAVFFEAGPVGKKSAPSKARALATGKGLCALASSGACQVEVSLKTRGWHAVYLGLAGRSGALSQVVNVKLSGDAAYRSFQSTVHEEVFFKVADLSERNLVVSQEASGQHGACLCYLKLVPLTDQEVMALRQEQSGQKTRRLIGTMDGFSFLHAHHPKTEEEVRELFEPFRNSDFGTIWWQFTGADLVNYQSEYGTISGDAMEVFPRAGDGYFTDSVRTLIRNGVDLTHLAVEACRDMGIKIHICLRPAAWKAGWPFEEYFCSRFYEAHPEWRCYDSNGVPAARMSFAVPQVRAHLLNILQETLESEPDGLSILYNRGVPLILWEDAFCVLFRERYGADALRVPEDDPRIYELRADIMTQWMRQVRELLDGFQKRRQLKQRLVLSAMCLGTEADNRKFGLDVARWVKEGLIDQIGVCPGAMHSSTNQIDVDYYKSVIAGTDVTFYPGMIAWRLPNPKDLFRQADAWYEAGADGIMVWDPEAKMADGRFWSKLSRMGHKKEVKLWTSDCGQAPYAADILAIGDDPPSRWSADAGF